MTKLTLDPDALAVDSFATAGSDAEARGTVQGQADPTLRCTLLLCPSVSPATCVTDDTFRNC